MGRMARPSGIQLTPSMATNIETITDDFCKDWVATTQDGTNFLEKGGMKAMGDSMANGVVLVMSLWDDHYANMLWLDSTYPIGSTDPGADRGTCKSTSGVPKDVEESQPNSTVTFSKISFGPIGSTFRRRRRSTVVVEHVSSIFLPFLYMFL